MIIKSCHPFLMLACLGLIIGVIASCSIETRHRLLTFVFDGVPPLGQSQTTTTLTTAAAPVRLIPPAVPRKMPVVPVMVSSHQPYQERKCTGCHDMTSTQAVNPQVELCDRCHLDLRIRNRWDHGPINVGKCAPCHVAHESPYPHLLDLPQPEVCIRCHEEGLSRSPAYHNVPDLEQCTRCHDPHRASSEKAKAA